MTTGTDIDRQARAILQDKDIVTWAAVDMIDWINAFQRELHTHKPKAFTAARKLDVIARIARQTLPAGVSQLLDITANVGDDGEATGRAITRTTAERLSASRPTWRSDSGTAVRHWMSDDRDPTGYEVWPRLTVDKEVEAIVVNEPTAIAELTDDLSCDGTYENAGVHYVLSQAYSQNGADSMHADLAAAHYGLFANLIGLQIKQQKKASAGANSTVNPAHPIVDKNGAP